MAEAVHLTLSADEALVLYEWLARTDDAGEQLIEHWSEQRALWALQAELAKILVEPFDPNYQELLEAARERLVAGIAEPDRKRVK